MSLVGELGGITSLLTVLISSIVGTITNFAIDFSMIRNSFTVPKPKTSVFGSSDVRSQSLLGKEETKNTVNLSRSKF